MDLFVEIDGLVGQEELTGLQERSIVECGSWKDRRWRQYHRWGKRANRVPLQERQENQLLSD